MCIEALRAAMSDEATSRVAGMAEIIELRALLDRVEAQWLSAVHEVAKSGEIQSTTGLTPTDWLADNCRLLHREARAKIKLANALANTTLVGDAFAAGTLSLTQASALVRARTKRTASMFDEQEAALVELSGALSADQFDVLMRQWYRRADAATAHKDADDVRDERSMFLAPIADEAWALQGTLTPEQGETLNEAILGLVKEEWQGDEETRTLAQRRSDALTSLARFWLNHQQNVTVHDHRPHISVSIDLDALIASFGQTGGNNNNDDNDAGPEPRWASNGRFTPLRNHPTPDTSCNDTTSHGGAGQRRVRTGARGRGGGVTAAGMWLDPATIDRLLCDCLLTRVLTADGLPLDAGRTTRTIPAHIRRQVVARDRHCRYKNCTRPAAWCEVHHVVEYDEGGTHSVLNCVLLCNEHHDRIHRLHERVVLHHDGRVDIVTELAGVATVSTSRPPPDVGWVFRKPTLRSKRQQDLQRRSMILALREAQQVANWTKRDFATAEQRAEVVDGIVQWALDHPPVPGKPLEPLRLRLVPAS